MSRVGSRVISIPEGVELTIVDSTVKAKGPKGELSLDLHPAIKVEVNDGQVSVAKATTNNKLTSALRGTVIRLVSNLMTGVKDGFTRNLEIQGVGYRASNKGKDLELVVGYSHPVLIEAPEGIELKVQKNIISVAGLDKQLVGQVAANIRSVRPPEPYKGKGIRYVGEHVRRKAGKAAKAAGGAA
ncbi:50S ribosomal protein L6 [Candidatus Berkelbacteria bacterium]|nr:50S ribosomal protein L6 [Candidatus Berkelbacteria bacterium]